MGRGGASEKTVLAAGRTAQKIFFRGGPLCAATCSHDKAFVQVLLSQLAALG